MTAVWSLLVACFVAFGGVGRAELRGELGVAAAAPGKAAVAVVHAVATRSTSHIAASRTRGHERRLSPATLPAAFSLRTPPLRTLAEARTAVDGVALRRVATSSARGPPIA
jgi:hypothetical protein